MKYYFAITILIFSIGFLPELAKTDNKMQALELLQSLVDNPSEARKMRKKIKNASREEQKQYDELRTILENEINATSAMLPLKIDKYTTMEAATISGQNIAYKYTLSDDMDGIEYKKEIMVELNRNVQNNFCTSASGVWLIFGYTWSFFYFRENSEYYGGVIVDANRCGFE
jgi:hypothetical protein